MPWLTVRKGSVKMKINYLKWLLYMLVAIIFGLVVSHFSDTFGSPNEVTTSIIASLALLRTCKEDE